MEPAPYIYVADVVDVVSYNLFNEEVQRRGSTKRFNEEVQQEFHREGKQMSAQ